MKIELHCWHCGTSFEHEHGQGRLPRWCSTRSRKAAQRERNGGKALAELLAKHEADRLAYVQSRTA
jgi:hypothetical protein